MNTVIIWQTYPEYFYKSQDYKTLTCLRAPRLDSLQREIIEGRIR